MSDVRIGLVAEGKTDKIIIEAALRAILGKRTFVMTSLQPEPGLPSGEAGHLGGGWGGVYRWCRQLVSMQAPVANNPSLSGFDLILLHLDADVAEENYDNANITNGPGDLPCHRPCPPATDSVDALRQVLLGWIDLVGETLPPARWVFCNPSLCSEAWLITALHHHSVPAIITEIECNQNLENWLSQRPIKEGDRFISNGKKCPRAYQEVTSRITDAWEVVCTHCSQAHRFDSEVRAALV